MVVSEAKSLLPWSWCSERERRATDKKPMGETISAGEEMGVTRNEWWVLPKCRGEVESQKGDEGVLAIQKITDVHPSGH